MRSSAPKRPYLTVLMCAVVGSVGALVLAQAQVNVTTSHNDSARTGATLTETTLNSSNVNVTQFGKLYERTLDDEVYAQPLYMSNLNIAGVGVRNVVFVATVNDSVYAFDADNTSASSPLWKIAYANPPNVVPVSHDDVGQACGPYVDFDGNIGIVGTPVIDAATLTMYVVVRTIENGTSFVQRLHAINITNGIDRQPAVTIQGSVVGSGDGANGGQVPFNARTENQRAALLLDHGIVYIAWGSHCDQGPYHGWIMGYNAQTLQQTMIYNTTPNGGLGGIWQSGGGLSADAQGNLYGLTGNGSFSANGQERGNSFIKVSPQGLLLDSFTPYNWSFLNSTDGDLGIQRALLVPGTNLVVGGGKEGVMYVVDRTNLGKFRSQDNSQIVQSFQASTASRMNGSPVYWNGPVYGPAIYVWPAGDPLKVFKLVNGRFQVPAAAQSSVLATGEMPGGILSLSANGSAPGTGIVWATISRGGDANHSVQPGIIRAMDAESVTRELWNSEQFSARDRLGIFAKFGMPTIAGGKVFVPTFSSKLVVYGLLGGVPGNTPPVVSAGADQTVSLGDPVTLTGTATDDGIPAPASLTTSWTLVSGPAPITLATPNAVSTTVTFTVGGVYTIRFSASDGAAVSADDVVVVVNSTSGVGTGLFAQYFNDAGNNTFFTALEITRVDPTINFNWGLGSVSTPNMQADNFSARWSGQVLAPATGTYTFTTTSDDGVRLWVDNQLLIDDWHDQGPTTMSATKALTSGVKYDIRLEYYDKADGATIVLKWAYPGQSQQIIPQSLLFPAPPVNQPPAVDAGVDQIITLTQAATLDGRIQDDGLPNPPGFTAVAWTKISGREASEGGTVTFADAHDPTTTATFGATGTYVLRLTANDGAVTVSDDVTITVNAAPPPGTIMAAQSTGLSNDAPATTISLTFGAPAGAGHLIIAAASWGASGAMTCSDNQGNAYVTLPVQYDGTNNQSLGVCYAANAKAGPTTVTATFGASALYRRLLLHEYINVATTNPLDVTAGNIAVATTAANGVTTNAATMTGNNDLVFAVVMDDAGTATIQPGTGFALRASVNNADLFSEDRVSTSTGSAAGTFTFSSAHRYLARMAAFKAGVPPDSTPPNVTLTAPVDGATVAGMVPFSATASDNVGVVGLQFKVGGVAVGPEITNGNYTYTWDSTTVGNGSRIVTATARDAAGNTRTTANVTVTVNNVDSTPPTFQNVQATNVTTTGATITWTTNEAATSRVQYGPDTTYSQATTLDSSPVIGHSQTLSGLTPGTQYFFKVLSSDASGNSGAATGTFTTVTPDTTAPVISLVNVTGIGLTGATINWTTNEAATTQVRYGTDTNYGFSTTFNPALTTGHTQTLSGLSPATTYYFRVLSSDASGNPASADSFLTTAAPDLTPPVLSAVTVTNITSSSATVTWTTNEAGTSQVAYGLTTGYGALTTLDPAYLLSHSRTLTNLQVGTQYHVQAISADAAGNPGVSNDVPFTTLPGEAAVPTVGLISRWIFNETSGTTAADSTGAANATLTSFACTTLNCNAASGWTTPGKFVGALNFDNTDDVVSAGTPAALNALGSFTYAAWIFPRGLGEGSAGRIVDKSGTGYKRFRLDNVTANSFYGEVRLATTNAVATSAANTVTLNQWQHVVMTYDDTTKVLRIYKDGTQVATATGTGAPQSDATGALIIGNNSGGTATFNGLIDDVIVYNRALSPLEVQTLASGAPDLTAPQISSLTATGTTTTAATINWNTDEFSSSRVEYGLTTNYGTTTALNAALVQGHTVPLTGLQPSSTYYVRVISADSSGNVSQVNGLQVTTLTPDTTPPTVAISTPGAGNVSGPVTLTASAGDDIGVASVQYFLDGTTALSGLLTSSPYSLVWNTATVVNGNHTLTAVAKDTAGNTTTSAGIVVNVSNATTVAFVQSASGSNDANSKTIVQAFTTSVQAGDLIVVAASWGNNSALTCSDSQANVYTTITVQYDNINHQSLGICYAPNSKAGTTSVTATVGASAGYRRILVHEYRGMALTSPVDVTAATMANGTTAANAITTGSATTTLAGDLIFAAAMDDDGTTTIQAGTGFTLRASAPSQDLASEDRVLAAPGAVAGTFTFSNAHRYLARVVAFKGGS